MSKAIFFKGLSFSYVRQITTIVIGIVSVPLMLNYFGDALFGIWSLIFGLAMYLNNIAFGIPSAMSTLVAKSNDLNKKYKILKRSTLLLSILIFILLLLFLLTIFINTDWIISLLGNIEQKYVEVTKQIFIIFVIVTLIKIPLNLYMHFFVGMNLVFISEFYQMLNVVFGFISLVLTIFFKLDIYNFVLLTLSLQIILGFVSLIHVLVKFHFLKTLDKPDEKIDVTKDIIKSGFAFFQVGIAASIVWSTDNLVITHFLSAEYVTSYTIAFKMFTYIFIFSAIINGVVGPIYGNAYAKNNFEKINIYLSTILKLLPILGGAVWFSLLFFSKDIIDLWTGNEKAFGGYLLIFSLGLYGYILAYVNTYATLLNSFNYVNKTLHIAWGEAFLNIILSIILIKFFGIGGVALATALSAFFTAFIFLPKSIVKLTKKQIYFNYTFNQKHFILLILPSLLIAIGSIYINYFIIKLFLYFVVSLAYVFFTWKFLEESDKILFVNILKKRDEIG